MFRCSIYFSSSKRDFYNNTVCSCLLPLVKNDLNVVFPDINFVNYYLSLTLFYYNLFFFSRLICKYVNKVNEFE